MDYPMEKPDLKTASLKEIIHYLAYLDKTYKYDNENQYVNMLGNGDIVDFLRDLIVARQRRADPFNKYIKLVGHARNIPQETIDKLIKANNKEIPVTELNNLDVINMDTMPPVSSVNNAPSAAAGGSRRSRRRTRHRKNSRKSRKSRRNKRSRF